MAELKSVPVTPPQPDLAAYPISELYIYREWDRASFERAFGQQAPPFDASQAVKKWFDSTGATTFNVFDEAARGFTAISLSPDVVQSVNLPGAYRWEKYVAPMPTITYPIFTGQAMVDSSFASHRHDAEALAAALGGQLREQTSPLHTPYQYANADPDVKVWEVSIGGGDKYFLAAPLIAQWYAYGVGHPGTWNTTGAYPQFTPAPDFTSPQAGGPVPLTPPAIPVPCRALLPNEAVGVGAMATSLIVRTDKKIDLPPGGGVGGSGSFSADDRAALSHIAERLDYLISKLQI